MTMQKSKCEHCGSQVAPANTCPKCGKDHSDEWIVKATYYGEFADIWFAYPFLAWTIYTFNDVNFFTWLKVGFFWGFAIAVVIAINKENHKIIKFELDQESQLYKNFRKDCIDMNCWDPNSFDNAFKLKGLKTYLYDGHHYLIESEYNWFLLRYS